MDYKKFDINNREDVETFIKLINDFSISYLNIAKIYGRNSISFIYNVAKKLNIKLPNRRQYLNDLYNNKQIESKTNNISCVALAPLNYSPKVLSFRYGTRNNIHVYIPELNKIVTLKSLEKILKKQLNMELYTWECRWILGLNIDLISTEEWAEKIIERFYSNKKFYTKQYIKKQLLLNPSYKFTGFIVKEDIIPEILNSFDNTKIKDDFDFSLLPEVISSKFKSFQIKNKETGNIVLTNYNFIVEQGINPFKVGPKRKTTEDFKLQSINKFGVGSFEILSEYFGNDLEITIKCNKCGSIFRTTPSTHLESKFGGCTTCGNNNLSESRSFSINDIQKQIDNIYGVNKYLCLDYKNMKTNITLKNLETGEIFFQDPENIIYHSITDPQINKKSSGEILVEKWLINNNISYQTQKKVNIKHNNSNYVIIDFVVTLNDSTIWIEYNGKQHYIFSSRYNNFNENDLERQKLRDLAVKVYCQENNISFVEIPYVLYSYKNINIFLNSVLIKNIPQENILVYENLYKGITKLNEIDKLGLF